MVKKIKDKFPMNDDRKGVFEDDSKINQYINMKQLRDKELDEKRKKYVSIEKNEIR